MPLWKAAQPEVYVADAALYSEENLKALGKTPWISRLPATIAPGATVDADTTVGDVHRQFLG